MGSRNSLPLAILGAILLALSTLWMAPEEVEHRAVRALLVDVSASATRPSPKYASRVRAELEQEALAALESGEELLVVLAGSEVRRAFGPGSPEELRAELRGEAGPPLNPIPTGESGARSELARGVRLVEELLESAGATEASLLVVGDGTVTGEDPARWIRRLAARGLHWRGLRRLGPELTDLALGELRAPRQLEQGAPLIASVRVERREGARGERPYDQLELRATDATGVRTSVLELDKLYDRAEARPGSGRATADYRFALGAAGLGRTVLEARLRSSTSELAADASSENDSLRSFVRAGEPLVVGWLAAEPLEPTLRAYARRLPAGFSSVFLEPGQVGATLPQLDALLVFDRSLDELPAALCESFVKSGGGLFLAGGWNLLSGWDAAGEVSRLRELLPLQLDPGAPGERDVIVLVDGSGSMAGEPFEQVRRAVRDLVRAAPPRDRVGLTFFTQALHASTSLRLPGAEASSQEERERLARELLGARVPGGTTRILDSLEELTLTRERSNQEALVLLLSDGREDSDVIDPVERAAALRTRLAAASAELVVFAIGEEADLDFLRTLVSEEEALHAGDELAELGALFRREVNRERVRAADRIPLATRVGPLGSQLFAAELEPVPLRRLLRMNLAEGAEPVLVSARGEPVLAAHRVGRGRVALLASLPFADWGDEWSARLGDLVPVLGWCARRPAGSRGPSLESEEKRLVLRGLPEGTPLVLMAEVIDPGSTAAPRELVFARPTSGSGVSDPGVRTSELPRWLSELGAGLSEVRLRDSGGELLFTLPLARSRAPEFEEPRQRWSLPALPAGGFRSFDSTNRQAQGGAPTGHPAALGLLIAGSSLVLAAAWRLGFGSSRQGVGRTDR